MSDYDDDPRDENESSGIDSEESWTDYMDEGDISGNGPDDDNIDPD